MNIKHTLSKLAAAACLTALLAPMAQVAHAADSLDLSRYSVSATYGLDIFNGTSGGLSGLEGSAIAYAQDRGTLFFVGDEGTGIIEVSRTGQTVSSMTFNWAGTGSTKNDTEGLTYLGNGTFVVTEERLQNAYKFNYQAGGTVALGSAAYASLGPTIGNIGIEGISYDPRNGGYVAVKQDDPAKLSFYNTLSFSTTAAADAVASLEFVGPASNSSLFGLLSLSDVQTLAPVSALQGSAAADNLLLLSLDSRLLVEITRAGIIKSSFDLSNVLPHNGIEGVTVAPDGTIYLVAEQVQDGSNLLPNPQSQLIVLTAAPVPEPESCALALAALGALWAVGRRKAA
jgi:uncharacterized protein YjiK